tara:strand:- start:383 stop:511 length:129 start_codon:yes stop_codon:yes gene_type:complete
MLFSEVLSDVLAVCAALLGIFVVFLLARVVWDLAGSFLSWVI